jgi:hypothetical protein
MAQLPTRALGDSGLEVSAVGLVQELDPLLAT